MKEETPRIAADSGLYRMKWEYEREKNSSPDLLCFGTADMDYRSPEPVLDALQNVLDRGHLGYPMVPDRFYAAIHDWLERTTGWSVGRKMLCVSMCWCLYGRKRHTFHTYKAAGYGDHPYTCTFLL